MLILYFSDFRLERDRERMTESDWPGYIWRSPSGHRVSPTSFASPLHHVGFSCRHNDIKVYFQLTFNFCQSLPNTSLKWSCITLYICRPQSCWTGKMRLDWSFGEDQSLVSAFTWAAVCRTRLRAKLVYGLVSSSFFLGFDLTYPISDWKLTFYFQSPKQTWTSFICVYLLKFPELQI